MIELLTLIGIFYFTYCIVSGFKTMVANAAKKAVDEALAKRDRIADEMQP
jgi:hypothetical protein